MVGEVRKAVHPPFGAHTNTSGKIREHLIDRELEAQVAAPTKVA